MNNFEQQNVICKQKQGTVNKHFDFLMLFIQICLKFIGNNDVHFMQYHFDFTEIITTD